MNKFLSLGAAAFALVLTGCNDSQVSSGASWGVDRISYGGYYGGNWDYRGHMQRRQRHWRDYNDRRWGGRPGWNHPDRPYDDGTRWGGRPSRPRDDGGNWGDGNGRPGNDLPRQDPPDFGGGGNDRPGNDLPRQDPPDFGGGGNDRPGNDLPRQDPPRHDGNDNPFGGGGSNSPGNDRPRGGGSNQGGSDGGPAFGNRLFAGGVMPMMAASKAPTLTKEDAAVYARIGKTYGIGPKTSTRVLESLNRAAVGDFGGLADLGLNKKSLAAAKRNNGRLAAAELDRLSRKLGVSQRKLDSMIQDLLGR